MSPAATSLSDPVIKSNKQKHPESGFHGQCL